MGRRGTERGERSPLLAGGGHGRSIQAAGPEDDASGSSASASRSPAVTVNGILCAMVPLMGSFSFGYTMLLTSSITRVINGTAQGTVLMNNATDGGLGMTDDENSLFMSAACLGAMIGASTGSLLLSALGRRRSLMASTLPFIAGAILQAKAQTFLVLMVGRLLTGAGIGLTSSAVPMYIAEVAPPSIRGMMGTAHQLSIVVGCMAGTAIGIPFAGEWRLMSWAALPCPCLLLLATVFIPPSPRWLVSKGRVDAARTALRQLRGGGDLALLESELADLQAADAEASAASSAKDASSPAHSSGTAVILKTGAITALLLTFQQLSGVGAVLFYGGGIFTDAGFKDANVSATIAQVVQFLITIVAVILVDKLGRKVLLLVSILIMLTSMGLLGLFFYVQDHESKRAGLEHVQAHGLGSAQGSAPVMNKMEPIFALVFVLLYWVGFASGMGALPWLLMSELTPIRAAGMVSSFATLANWGAAFAVAALFPTMIKTLGESGSFWLFGGTLAVTFVFVAVFLPETKGQSLQDIERYFQGRVQLPRLSRWDLKLIATVAVALAAFAFGIVGHTFRLFG